MIGIDTMDNRELERHLICISDKVDKVIAHIEVINKRLDETEHMYQKVKAKTQ
jgi:hypothetical protein